MCGPWKVIGANFPLSPFSPPPFPRRGESSPDIDMGVFRKPRGRCVIHCPTVQLLQPIPGWIRRAKRSGAQAKEGRVGGSLANVQEAMGAQPCVVIFYPAAFSSRFIWRCSTDNSPKTIRFEGEGEKTTLWVLGYLARYSSGHLDWGSIRRSNSQIEKMMQKGGILWGKKQTKKHIISGLWTKLEANFACLNLGKKEVKRLVSGVRKYKLRVLHAPQVLILIAMQMWEVKCPPMKLSEIPWYCGIPCGTHWLRLLGCWSSTFDSPGWLGVYTLFCPPGLLAFISVLQEYSQSRPLEKLPSLLPSPSMLQPPSRGGGHSPVWRNAAGLASFHSNNRRSFGVRRRQQKRREMKKWWAAEPSAFCMAVWFMQVGVLVGVMIRILAGVD